METGKGVFSKMDRQRGNWRKSALFDYIFKKLCEPGRWDRDADRAEQPAEGLTEATGHLPRDNIWASDVFRLQAAKPGG